MREREFVGLWFALAILGAVAVLAYRSIDATAETLGWVEQTHRVRQQREEVASLYARAASARRAYVVAGDDSQLAEAPALDARLARALDDERDLLRNDSGQRARLDQLAGLYQQRIRGLQGQVEVRRKEGLATETADGLSLTSRIRELRDEMDQEENRRLAERDARTRGDVARTKLAEVVGTCASFAILLFAFRRLREEIRRRRRSEEALKEDLTERRKAAEALARAKEAQEAANQELEAFSYSVAHDLRAPLRAIDGFSAILAEDAAPKLSDRDREHLGRVRAATKRMGELIDALLGLSRVARRELRREDVDLTKLATESASRLREANPGRVVDLVVEDGLAARGDERLLAAVFDNLLGNAWKFTGKRDHAKVEVGKTTKDGQPVLYVRDNGAGFDGNAAPRLFGAFQRLHPSADFEGTGIGLATVQRIVRRHGGRIWAEGEVDRGATFYFTL